MNSITLDNLINFFTFKNFIIILLVIVVIYAFIKLQQINYDKNNREDFEDENVSVEAIKNIGIISKNIMENNTVIINGNLELDQLGQNNILPTQSIVLWYWDMESRGNFFYKYVPPGWALCDGRYAYMDDNENTIYEDYYNDDGTIIKNGYVRTPNLPPIYNIVDEGDDRREREYYFIIKL